MGIFKTQGGSQKYKTLNWGGSGRVGNFPQIVLCFHYDASPYA